MIKFIYIFFLAWAFNLNCIAQTRMELEKKRKSLSSQINKTNQLLKKATVSKKIAQKNIHVLKEQIGSKQELIFDLKQELDSTEQSVDRKIAIIEAMEIDLNMLKTNYKKLIRALYRLTINQSNSSYQFASNSSNIAFMQLTYLQHLEKHRKKQVRYVSKTQESLINRINFIENLTLDKNIQLQKEYEQQETIVNKIEGNGLKVVQLKKEERRLRSKLKHKKHLKYQMSKKIEKIIHQQIANAKTEARVHSNKKKGKTKKALESRTKVKSNSAVKLSKNTFAKQKGELISPIYEGVVVGRFGKYKHPKFKDIEVVNNGIDIKGKHNSVVRNVFEGTVVSVFAIPGLNNAVMVKHGDYFTTYSNIAKVYVKKGDELKTGEQIGTIGRDSNEGGYILHFEIWRNKRKENPALWIKKT